MRSPGRSVSQFIESWTFAEQADVISFLALYALFVCLRALFRLLQGPFVLRVTLTDATISGPDSWRLAEDRIEVANIDWQRSGINEGKLIIRDQRHSEIIVPLWFYSKPTRARLKDYWSTIVRQHMERPRGYGSA